MTKKQIKLQLEKTKKHIRKLAKHELKHNGDVKFIFKDLEIHFRSNKWDLSYVSYLNSSKLSYLIFNCMLELKGYKIVYDKNKMSVVIRKSS